jgi:transposase
MEAVLKCCCGLDVHQATVVACVLDEQKKHVRTFETTTRALLEMADWLGELGCEQVAMEGTGIYWRPVYAMLEGHAFGLTVANARHIKKVPGRKTDVSDAEWIAKLLRHGLLKSSFVPPKPIAELRDLTRYRKKLVQSRTAERNRTQRLLETANIKLATVLSDVFGRSGMEMLRALLEGTMSPIEIAQLARGKARSKLAELEVALEGCFDEHHRFMLTIQLQRLDAIGNDIAAVDGRIDAQLTSLAMERARLQTIPGVDRIASAQLLAELGPDMSVFDGAPQVASWAGVCPGSCESAGKNKTGKLRKGNRYLTTALVESAQAAVRKRGTYLRAKFHKLKARRGYKRAIIAIAHKILLAAFHILRDGVPYKDLGPTYLDELNETRTVRTLVGRLERLGYAVAAEKPQPA